MRVVVPYVKLYPETRAALEADRAQAEYIDVSASQTAYHELLARLWAEGGWINVEQDIVVRPGCLQELWNCDHDWCGFAYALSAGYGSYLGCAKFSDQLVRARPNVIYDIDLLPPDGTPRHYWGRLDTRLRQVLEEKEGQRMHVHWPPVQHLNPVQRLPIYQCDHGHTIPDSLLQQGPPPYVCPTCQDAEVEPTVAPTAKVGTAISARRVKRRTGMPAS